MPRPVKVIMRTFVVQINQRGVQDMIDLPGTTYQCSCLNGQVIFHQTRHGNTTYLLWYIHRQGSLAMVSP